jgi:hypothetical protein
MFNWLKNLFKGTSTITDEAASFPFPTAKDQAELAPYKVEAPAIKTEVAKQPAKIPGQPKKAPVKKPAVGTRGRKPKANTVKK